MKALVRFEDDIYLISVNDKNKDEVEEGLVSKLNKTRWSDEAVIKTDVNDCYTIIAYFNDETEMM